MNTCVFITGTNCTGKSTLARALMRRFGGVTETTADTTFCGGAAAFAGRYSGKHGGVDSLNSTSVLEGVVRRALARVGTVFCEGSYLDTFGLNLTNALFAAEAQLVVLLHCPVGVLSRRIKDRRRSPLTPQREAAVMEGVARKQRRCVSAARKYASIGVPVAAFDTSATATEEIADAVVAHLKAG